MVYSCSTLVLLGLLLSVQGQLYDGSQCQLRGQAGICRLINRCQPVYEDLISGRRPEVVCGYQGSTPIVCCPNTGASGNGNGGNNFPQATTTPRPVWGRPTPRPTQRPTPRPTQAPPNARPSVQMCAEYARSVYTLVDEPILGGGSGQAANVSQCAIKSKKLIVGGIKADPKEFPHMASIGYINGRDVAWSCGGSLISESFVLTAAHCLNSIQWGAAEWVRVGDLNIRSNSDDARPQDRRIERRIPHPNYRRPAQYNDIALIKMVSTVSFTAYVRPACLSFQSRISEGEKAVATGWGIVDWFDDEGSDDLLKVTLPVVSQAQCNRFFNDEGNRLPNGIDGNSQLCAGQDGKDTCQGDSGGPLVVYSTRQECMYDIIGVTSFGKLCGSVAPGVYTKVATYLSWIESVVWPNFWSNSRSRRTQG